MNIRLAVPNARCDSLRNFIGLGNSLALFLSALIVGYVLGRRINEEATLEARALHHRSSKFAHVVSSNECIP